MAPPKKQSTPSTPPSKLGRIFPLPKSKTQEERLIAVEEATAESVSREIFDKEFGNLKESLTEQRSLSFSVIIGVAVVFVFTIGIIGVELMLFHTHQNDDLHSIQTQSDAKILELREKEFKDNVLYQTEIESLKKQIEQLTQPKKK